MKNVKSSIHPIAVEITVGEHEQEGALHGYRVTNCFLNGIRVGQRRYNAKGVLVLETPLQDGLKHGRELTWDDDGKLLLREPYVKGKIHGTAKQYGRDGRVIGTYTLIYGTGLDIWRQENEDRTIFISEVHHLQDGVPHGYEWHFASSRVELWHERSWSLGKLHGIERIWNNKGKLRRGYPKFYIMDKVVSIREYLKLALTDKSLPAYREVEDFPTRNFPAEIQEILAS